jgi:hypothetical protein
MGFPGIDCCCNSDRENYTARSMMTTFVLSVLLATFTGQVQTPASSPSIDEKEASAARLKYMKQSATVYDIRLDDDRKTPLKLLPEPALRWNNPVSGVSDGLLVLWVGPDDRPELAAQVFIAAGTKDLWLHEFQSLSLGPLTVSRNGAAQWQPRKPGVEMKIIDDASPPAETPAQRLAQMRTIAKNFAAADDFEGKSRWELRLLAKPLHRYGKPKSDILDGALFAFAHGTDPEVFLIIESRSKAGKERWHYGLAAMTAYALRASYQGKDVWNRPWQQPPFDPKEPFYILKYVPDSAK